ncbi:prepilin-type N-terminal cleavage/methylation domain-containing protein [Anaerovirgula multivorans]|uniref:Prepilin-type N-terminal cleavage/methylation domain-containing protein n=1 Tax=Anaerovirgula multivorans TaxID=312168 RepID=A0A238ZSQ9_9FIRM|nr:prepilin-type N-terminal cleavage/methylation domain-containing protein [Anaerovirgula multivorans]SNR86457.1 prepilin-type N-terminal cleavage/methylation domain-containing protein [Anaerovirgula multivorans]
MIQNRKGITLIELLMVLSVMSIIVVLSFSVYIFGMKSFTLQSTNVENQSNVRYATSYITKEIRKAESVEVLGNILTINGTDEYKLVDNIIWRNSNELVTGIEHFNMSKSGNKISLEIISLSNSDGCFSSLSSKIYIRE